MQPISFGEPGKLSRKPSHDARSKQKHDIPDSRSTTSRGALPKNRANKQRIVLNGNIESLDRTSFSQRVNQ
eukprot:1725665-Amphidinium_carterae.1